MRNTVVTLLLLPVVAWASCASKRKKEESLCAGAGTADDVLRNVDLKGKVAIVTGGDSGLGYATSLALSRRGATVVIGNRNQTRGAEAAKTIQKETKQKVVFFPLDLSSNDSVREFAGNFNKSAHLGKDLHILVNNAGIMGPSKKIGDSDRESVLQIDYLGHFLLTELLLPYLRKSGNTSSGTKRIVNVASGAHSTACLFADLKGDCFKDWKHLLPSHIVPSKEILVNISGYNNVKINTSSYGIAKFANIMHAKALAQEEGNHGIQAFSVTPGFVATPMTAGFDKTRRKMICDDQMKKNSANTCPFTPEAGAAVIAMCATGQDLKNGAYYSKSDGCKAAAVTMQGFEESMIKELYTTSQKWVGATSAEDKLVNIVI